MKNILIVGSQHGNELLGDALIEYISSRRKELLPNISYIIGNIRAKKANVRYIDCDLNRSYNGKSSKYEERRGQRIRRYIKQNNFDLVLDMHTTTCDQPPCLIIPSVNVANVQFLRSCSIDKIVHMDHDIVKTSLIGVCQQAVSVEINRHQVDDILLDKLCDDIARYVDGRDAHVLKSAYVIDGPLGKSEISETDAKKLQNFHESPYGFYPVLVGENSYKVQTNYIGYKASILQNYNEQLTEVGYNEDNE